MFKYNGKSYELPKKTMKLNEAIEAVNNATSTSEAYVKMLDFVILALGEEKVIELLETTDIDEIDLTQLNILSNAIVMGYDMAIYKGQEEFSNQLANNKAVKAVIEAGKSANYLNSIKK